MALHNAERTLVDLPLIALSEVYYAAAEFVVFTLAFGVEIPQSGIDFEVLGFHCGFEVAVDVADARTRAACRHFRDVLGKQAYFGLIRRTCFKRESLACLGAVFQKHETLRARRPYKLLFVSFELFYVFEIAFIILFVELLGLLVARAFGLSACRAEEISHYVVELRHRNGGKSNSKRNQKRKQAADKNGKPFRTHLFACLFSLCHISFSYSYFKKRNCAETVPPP